jgi:hypothetical protein
MKDDSSGVKKITIRMVARDSFDGSVVKNNPHVINISEYKEEKIKHEDFMSGYTFEFLIDSVMLFGNGLWTAGKGFFGMSQWAVITIWEGLKQLFKFAFSKPVNPKDTQTTTRGRNGGAK